jgi:glycosyltransferase involved in cell wall biosynthesis
MRRSHRIFFHNEDDLNLFIAARIVRKEQARVVKGSGVNLIEYVPRVPCEQSDHGPTFLFIGRLLKDKGLREFIAAAAEVKKTLVATFQVIGSLENHPKAIPPSAIMDAVEKGHIELVGSTGDVRPFLECADCLILPSYREGLPRVILEAAAMAKPVIATDVPGCRDAVDSGLTGFLCEARSASSLVDAIHRFAATPQEERVAMGLRARAKAQREFSEEKVVAAYAEAIGGLVIQAQSYGHGEALA